MVGTVVVNVETLLNIYSALLEQPRYGKDITVTGAVSALRPWYPLV